MHHSVYIRNCKCKVPFFQTDTKNMLIIEVKCVTASVTDKLWHFRIVFCVFLISLVADKSNQLTQCNFFLSGFTFSSYYMTSDRLLENDWGGLQAIMTVATSFILNHFKAVLSSPETKANSSCICSWTVWGLKTQLFIIFLLPLPDKSETRTTVHFTSPYEDCVVIQSMNIKNMGVNKQLLQDKMLNLKNSSVSNHLFKR